MRPRPQRLPAALRAGLCAGLACGALAGAALARGRDVPTPEWREGPIRYLITKDEAKVYKNLKTEAERRKFIELFWRRRDQTPETPLNEFRDQFWRRVQGANDLFNASAHDGWITDRGKMYILLGPPDETISEEVAKSHRGIILWVYRSTWARELGPNVVVAFAKDTTGEFRISTAPSTDADVFRGLDPNTPVHLLGASGAVQAQVQQVTGIGNTDPRLVAQGVASGLTELSMLADLGRLQQTDHLILNEFVTAQALFGELSVIASADYYKAEDGTTYAAITVSIRSKSLQYEDVGGLQAPRVSVYARLEDPESGELRVSFEGDRDFVPSPDNPGAAVNDYLQYQAGAGIAPGRYRARVTVHDRVAEKIGTYALEMEVPDFGGEQLQLSSITLAERLGPLPDHRESDRKTPYAFGSLQVLPKPGLAYAVDQEFAFYFQVYNARTDAQGGQPLLDLRYRFLRKQDEGYEPLGNPLQIPGQLQAAQGFSFPLQGWEVGLYRLEVQVTDRLDGSSATRSVDFLVR